MLQMMQRMMDGGKDAGEGKGESEAEGKGKGKGKGKGSGAGGGNGDGNGGNGGETGDPDNTAANSERRVPKNSGATGSSLPREFHKAMDAYNKGASEKNKSK